MNIGIVKNKRVISHYGGSVAGLRNLFVVSKLFLVMEDFNKTWGILVVEIKDYENRRVD